MSSNEMRELSDREQRRLDSAPAFNPYEAYTEVLSHNIFKFRQNDIYYDSKGQAVSVAPSPPKVTLGVKRLREGIVDSHRQASRLQQSQRVVGARKSSPLPPNVVKAMMENELARHAEDLGD